MVQGRYVFPFSQLRMTDVDRVGGKNASLGELLSQLTSAGIRVPDGFATTAEAFRLFIKESGLETRIAKRLEGACRSRCRNPPLGGRSALPCGTRKRNS